MTLVPTILCGGAGSRLWPVSREMHPKPFIELADGQNLLQKAFLRGALLPGVIEVLTVTNRETYFKAFGDMKKVNATNCALPFILEPTGRDTAAAVAAAALYVAEKDPDSILLVLAADHLIGDQIAFAEAVAQAKTLAKQDKIVTFGIQPLIAETAYGYIEAEGTRVVRFVEKPDIATAQAYLESGKFFWNSGMFCFKARVVLQEMQTHCPDILEAVRVSLATAEKGGGQENARIEMPRESFERVPARSFDYAVMEKTDHASVVACDIGWSDVGSWNALGDLVTSDAQGNRVEGEALLHNVSNCHIRGSGRLVGAVGIKDLVIIDTPDALLVADRNRAQDVKQLFAKLKASGHDAHRLHKTVHRPWGTYTILEEGEGFKIKRIVVTPGASLSLQMHHHRSEHWIVVAGMAKVVVGEEEHLVRTNESTYIPAGHKHRLTNPGLMDLVLIEVQSGAYLGEDDIVRFEDRYGRAG